MPVTALSLQDHPTPGVLVKTTEIGRFTLSKYTDGYELLLPSGDVLKAATGAALASALVLKGFSA